MNPTPLATPTWLLPVDPAEAPTGPAGTWYASLSRTSRPESEAYQHLRWLLNVLLCANQPASLASTNYYDCLLVPAADPLAVRIADAVTGQFLLTGVFTQAQAQALVYRPLPAWEIPLAVPPGVVAPPQELRSRWGAVSAGARPWFWEEIGAATAQPPRQGLVRAITEQEAIDRLREALPEAVPFRWISRAAYRLPAALLAEGQLEGEPAAP